MSSALAKESDPLRALEGMLTKDAKALRACILRGLVVVIGVVTALVAACIYVPQLREITASEGFRVATLVGVLVGIALLVGMALGRPGHAFQRFVFVYWIVASAALLAVAAHRVASSESVVLTLVAAGVLVLLASRYGMDTPRDLEHLGAPLFVALLVLLGVGLVNALVLGSPALETGLSLATIVVFCVYVVYDANQFVRERVCAHDCCEEGVFSIYMDFANIAVRLLGLQSDD